MTTKYYYLVVVTRITIRRRWVVPITPEAAVPSHGCADS